MCSDTNESGYRHTTSAIGSLSNSITNSVEGIGTSLQSNDSKLSDINDTLDFQETIIKGGLSNISHGLTQNRRGLRLHARQQKKLASKLETQLQHQFSALTEQIGKLCLTETKPNEFLFQGEHLQSIVLPLLLMKSDLARATQTLMSEGSMKLSASETQWIQGEFENLLSRGHQAALVASKSSIARPGMGPPSSHSEQSTMHQGKQPVQGTAKQSFRCTHWRKLYTEVGTLVVAGGREDRPDSPNQTSSKFDYQVHFLPKVGLRSASLSVFLSKLSRLSGEPEIRRLIRTYNTIPKNSRAIEYAKADDFRGLEMLFNTGKASVNDVDENGMSLVMVSPKIIE